MYFYHYYNNDDDFQNDYWGTPYHEPWVSRTELGEGKNRANYNKKMAGTYLTIEATGSGNIVWKVGDASNAKIIYYKKNDGPWTSITSTTAGASISVAAGDKVMFKGNNATYGTPNWPFSGGSSFMGTTCNFNVYGNIMSLINSESFDNLKSFPIGSTSTFAYLFSGCKVQNASGLCLPATELVENSYGYMFQNCTSLTTPPELPATKLAPNAYYYMFDGCSRLNTFQAVLPATHIEPYCYEGMFRGCGSLRTPPEINARNTAKYCYKLMFAYSGIRTAPSILRGDVVYYAACYEMFKGCGLLQNAPVLPATEIHGSGYIHMFEDCASLRNAPELPFTLLTYGPDDMGEETTGITQCHSMFKNCTSLETFPEILPATSVTNNCYTYMFQGCTKLTTAPILPATSLAGHGNCYGGMFSGCSSLNYIKCLATDLGTPSESLRSWVDGVAGSGTFVKDANATSWPTGVNGIPSGWMIINDGESYVLVDKNSAVPNSAIKVTSNTEWTATTSDSWISLSTTAGTSGETTITVTCTGSPSGTYREGTITIGENTIVVNQANLPADYTQVSCISSTYGGHQYINLGLLMCSASPISFQIEGKAKVKSGDSQGVLIGCMREASPYPGFLIRLANSSVLEYVKCNGDSQFNFGTVGSMLNINITQNSYTTDRIHNMPATLFCGLNGSGSPFRYVEAELYNLHIVTYGTELYLVPCLNSNNVPGLYDVVGGTFYDSDGSNPFTYSN